jgi:pyruvate formate lyase activating enzyme
MRMYFGGFIPLTTVDWPGRSACTVFLKGCPARCHYCHNPELQDFGPQIERVDIRQVKDLIKGSKPYISGVVFSGGEPLAQAQNITELVSWAWGQSIPVAIQTSGIFPEVLRFLVGEGFVDRLSLDLKFSWEDYDAQMGLTDVGFKVMSSLEIGYQAYTKTGLLQEFEIVHTTFKGESPKYIELLASLLPEITIVLQQGAVAGQEPPTHTDLVDLAVDHLGGHPVKIRTREGGEVNMTG